ncbi:hypothetical protein COO91_02886 [Nostoc flagelliforme CCNUN1]|uniref:Uncharacterized protein n=1 Tax=Nostoc flagelliforme CCNUN1 TaxID=2038116 RepID=A0A2K8SNG8_9NOSO|nr:hypothetical protein COO91_02886 [Nostoc flagelliforme CCNUN1]
MNLGNDSILERTRSPKTPNHHRKLISLTALLLEAIAATIIQRSFDNFIVRFQLLGFAR